jgi:uncharacterized Fe-S radical SAM superfamily protein PflX
MEYAKDTAELAHKEGLFNTFVTNGYMTPEAVKAIAPVLDVATVDFKAGGDPAFYKSVSAVPNVEPIYESLKELKVNGVHVEVTNLVIPKIGDDMRRIEDMATWIKDYLGRDTPFHLLRFHPDYKMTTTPATPIETLEKAYMIAKNVGLNYSLHRQCLRSPGENTYCPNCDEPVIKRYSFEITQWNLTDEMRLPSLWTIHPHKRQTSPNRIQISLRPLFNTSFYSFKSKIMWKILRPDAEAVTKNQLAKKSLARYFSVADNCKPAKFLIAQRTPARFDKNYTLEALWAEHARCTDEYYRIEHETDQASNFDKLSVPEKSYFELKWEIADRILQNCHFCLRKCGVNRKSGKVGYCGCGERISVSSLFEHTGEEPELVPSGTIFTMGCTIRCLHCQNWTIAQWAEESTGYAPQFLPLK